MGHVLIPIAESEESRTTIGNIVLDVAIHDSKWGYNDVWEHVYVVKIGKYEIQKEMFMKILKEVQDMFVDQKSKDIEFDMNPSIKDDPNVSKKFSYYWCACLQNNYYIVNIYVCDNKLRVVIKQKYPYLWTTNHETRFPENSIQWDVHWNIPFKLTNLGVDNTDSMEKIIKFFGGK